MTYLMIGLVVSTTFDDLGQGARGQAVDLLESRAGVWVWHYEYTGSDDPTRNTFQERNHINDGILTEDLEESCSLSTMPADYTDPLDPLLSKSDKNWDLAITVDLPEVVMIRSVFIAGHPDQTDFLQVQSGIDEPWKEPFCSKITNSNYVCNSLANKIKVSLSKDRPLNNLRIGICEIKAWSEPNMRNFVSLNIFFWGTPVGDLSLANSSTAYYVGSDYCLRANLVTPQKTDLWMDLLVSYPINSLFLATTTNPSHKLGSADLIVSVGNS